MRVLFASLTLLILVGNAAMAADKPQDLLLGKWQHPKVKTTLEFLKDGKVKYVSESFSTSGTYEFLDNTTLEIKYEFGGQEKISKVKVAITKDELTTEEQASRVVYKRVK